MSVLSGVSSVGPAEPVIFIGAGVASITAIEEMRGHGYDKPVVLLSKERHVPYDRPPLSKDVLYGERLDGVPLRPDSFYDDNAVDLRLGVEATTLDLDVNEVVTRSGERLTGGTVVLATGGEPRRLPLPGTDLRGVCELRTLDDALELKAQLTPGVRLVVIGGGFIGTEVAAAGVLRGAEVTILEAQAAPLAAVLPHVASYVVDHHRSHGVTVRGGVSVTGFEAARDGSDNRVTGVRLQQDDELVPADVVVVGVGMRPSDELARRAGIATDNGITVDQWSRTSNPTVFAIGDVASRSDGHGGHRRTEHWQSAVHDGRRLARNLLGLEATPTQPPWFWSDQFDVNIQMAGHPDENDGRIVRGDPQQLRCTVLFHRRGALTGVVTLNNGKDVRPALELIRSGRLVDLDSLSDPSVQLRTLARESIDALGRPQTS